MKNKKIVISVLFMLLLSSFSLSVIGVEIEKPICSNNRDDGKVYGYIETIGRCSTIGVPNLKIACGKNLFNYQTTYTNENGFYKFSDLTYYEAGTTFYLWIPFGQKVLGNGLTRIILNEENPEIRQYYFITYFLMFSLIHPV